jgi:DNA-binding NarL/FixJ family response regulator
VTGPVRADHKYSAVRCGFGSWTRCYPAVTRRLISEFVARPPDAVAAARMESLTNREREVAALAARGLSNHEIAEATHQRPAATTDDA